MLSLTVRIALTIGVNQALTIHLQTGEMSKIVTVTALTLTRESGAVTSVTPRTPTLISSFAMGPVAGLSGILVSP